MIDDQAAASPRYYPGFVTRAEHFLRVNAWNSLAGVTLTIAGTIAGEDGCVHPFVYTLVPTSNRVITQTIVPLECGVVLNCQAFASAGAPTRGQTFVRLELLQGGAASAISLGTIVQGYVTATVALAYPGSEIGSPVEGPGVIKTITNGAPAVGTDWSLTTPANVRWRPIALAATLTTSVAVATRVVELIIDDGANIYASMGANIGQAAALSFRYTAAPSNGLGTLTATDYLMPLPDWLILPAAHRMRTNTNIQAADQWGPQQLLVEEWLDV